MKTIKVKFVDFWKGFDPRNNFLMDILKQRYHIELSESPDYLIFSVFGFTNLNYERCVKIFYTGENLTPDFNICDYAIGFDYLSFGDRYMRLPLYAVYGIEKLASPKVIDKEKVLKRKFCSYVVSNNIGAPERSRFFHLLSEYKKVDSGGRWENNVGGPVPDKLDFIKDYKFNIAFENSMYDGYTTEKIMEPMLVNSLPVYWGNRLINKDFNPASFINVSDFPSQEAAVEHIVMLDNNDDMYLSILSKPWFNDENYLDWKVRFFHFFDNIFNRPIDECKYLTPYGFCRHYRNQLRSARLLKQRLRQLSNPLRWFR